MNRAARTWAVVLSTFFGITGVVVPKVLRPIHRVWMGFGNILGWINSKILLSVLFYIVVTPVRVIMSLAGSDPMNRKFDRQTDSYRVLRKPRQVSHVRHQF